MASKAIGFLNFKFGADLSGFERAMKKAQKKLKKFGKNVTKAGQNLSRNLTLPILALGAASIKAFDEQAKAEQKLLTSLKGREDIQQRLIEQAKELQKTTLFGDEATIAAQSMLAMMGLTEEEVVKLIPLIQDFATAKGMDLVTAADLVAKSMGSSTNALSRYGIEITGAVGSTERLDTAVNQLTEKFEGQAKAAALVGAGPLVQIGNQLGDIAEELGQRLMPYVTEFIGYLKTLIEKFDDLTESQKDNIVVWGLIVAAIGPVLIIIGKTATGIATLLSVLLVIGKTIITLVVPAFTVLYGIMLANPFGAMLAGLSLLAAGIAALVLSNDDATGSTNTLTESQKKLQSELEETARVERSLASFRNDKAAQQMWLSERTLMLKEKLANANTKEEKQLVKANIKLNDLKANLTFWGEQMKSTLLDQHAYDISLQYFKDAEKAVEDQIDVVAKLQKLVAKTTGPDGDPEKKVKQMEALSLATHDTFEEINLLTHRLDHLEMPEDLFNTHPLDKYRGALGDLGEQMANFFGKDIKELEQISHDAAMSIAKNLAQGADSWEEYGQTIKNVIRETIGALISEAVMTAALSALKSVPFPFNIIAAGIAAGVARTAFSTMVPEFAEGGLVYGPTTALIGEGVGTTASNPEVVAPLDKLKQYMGGGNQNIIVEGVLKGNDIYLSNRNTSINRLRTT